MAIGAFFVYQKFFSDKQTPKEKADVSEALSKTQKVTPPSNISYNVPYVKTETGATGKEVIVISKLAPMFNDATKKGIASTSLTYDEYAALSPNDRRAIEKGQFSVTPNGMLITGWDRLVSLLPAWALG